MHSLSPPSFSLLGEKVHTIWLELQAATFGIMCWKAHIENDRDKVKEPQASILGIAKPARLLNSDF